MQPSRSTTPSKSVSSSPVQKKDAPFFGPVSKKVMPKPQFKLKADKGQDPYEKEANDVAAQVVNQAPEGVQKMPLFNKISPLPQRQPQTVPEEEYAGAQSAAEPQAMEEEAQAMSEPQASAEPQLMEEEAQGMSELQTTAEPQLMEEAQEMSEPQTAEAPQSREEEAQSMGEPQANEEPQMMEEEAQGMSEPQATEEPQAMEEEAQSMDEPQTASLQAFNEGAPSKRAEGQPPSASAKIAAPLQASKGQGAPLPTGTQTEMEQAFGADFSKVRVHTDERAIGMNRDLRAQAFAHGRDIYFNSGKFAPETEKGKFLLSHELTHTIQQGAVNAKPVAADDEAATAGENTDTQAAAKDGNETRGNATGAIAKPAAGDATKTTGRSAAPAGADKKSSTPATSGKAEETDSKEGSAAAAGRPKSAEEDPNFQQVKEDATSTAAKQGRRESGKKLSANAQSAAPSPAKERSSRAQAGQVETMNQQPAGSFNPQKFKSALLKRIAEMMPKNEDDAEAFSKDNRMDAVRQETASQVATERDAAAGNIEQATTQEPNENAVQERKAENLKEARKGAKPADIKAGKATPPPRPDAEVSAPLQENVNAIDQRMTEAGVTEQQLAKSEEPQFTQALEARQSAQDHAQSAPEAFRQEEAGILDNTRQTAQVTGQQALTGMRTERLRTLGKVTGGQRKSMDKNTAARQKIVQGLEGIYQTTQKDVKTTLATLDTEVESRFERGSKNAKERFEAYVAKRMWRYKSKRYGGFGGGLLAVGDFFTGLPDEVNKFFQEGRDLFITLMDSVLDDIANLVAAQLTKAKAQIAEGRLKVQKFLKDLPENLRVLGRETAEKINDKFDQLDQDVDAKQDDLIDSIAEKYNTSLGEVDERINKMKEANRGLVDKAMDLINGVIETIRKLKEAIENLMSAIKSVLPVILADPIGFMGMLFEGIGKGIELFKTNIKKHLIGGLLKWLTGALGPMGITVPDNIFSLSGIFSLIAQVLGLGWDYIRKKAVKMMGEKAVQALEKGFEFFMILKTKGIAGLWEFLKDKFQDLKETVLGAIQNMLITKVIQAGVKWLLSLLIPGAGFIKALIAIKDFIVFFVESAIMLIPAVTEAILALASGAKSRVAKAIENGLGILIPTVIGLLARLIGIGGLSKRVGKIIKKIRKRIDKVITKLLLKAKRAARKLFRKGAIKKMVVKGKEKVATVLQFFGIKKKFKAKGKSHSVYYKKQGGKAQLMVASTPKSIEDFLKFYEKQYDLNENKENLISDIRKTDLPVVRTKTTELTAAIKAKNRKKQNRIQQSLLELNVVISEKLRKLLEGDSKTGKLIESYLLEGMTGTFASMPKPKNDILTPDHQPQAAIFSWAAYQSGLFGKTSNMMKRAKSRAAKGYAINLYHTRHVAGRTYGSKGKAKKEAFIKLARKNVAQKTTMQEKRNVVVNMMKKELSEDVKAVKRLINVNKNWDDIDRLDLPKKERESWKRKIKNNIKKGEDQLLQQDLDSLKS